MDWLIRYGDGSTFTSEDGKPWEAPREDVQRIYYRDERVDVAVAGSNPGRWGWKVDRNGENGRWFGFNDLTAFDEYLRTCPHPIPLFGRILHDHEWEEIVAEDVKGLFGIEKTSWRERERRPRP